MNKYDKMLELNKRKSEEKVERATLAIRTMVLEKEKVSVPALMQKTGLSRGFFYKNPIVRSEIDAAMEQQAGMVDPRRNIISQAMEKMCIRDRHWSWMRPTSSRKLPARCMGEVLEERTCRKSRIS